eukprot:TRINITY_DN2746_c1_g1_i2.p5 TRINITY_DN2746_c1_g1~~TRINITY_DN2746_c1_g1_i2.p5  ORF type:complete len:275 (+),score=-5.06 TRINITY_DN2746_c1_g1_i2:5925-6749(+)
MHSYMYNQNKQEVLNRLMIFSHYCDFYKNQLEQYFINLESNYIFRLIFILLFLGLNIEDNFELLSYFQIKGSFQGYFLSNEQINNNNKVFSLVTYYNFRCRIKTKFVRPKQDRSIDVLETLIITIFQQQKTHIIIMKILDMKGRDEQFKNKSIDYYFFFIKLQQVLVLQKKQLRKNNQSSQLVLSRNQRQLRQLLEYSLCKQNYQKNFKVIVGFFLSYVVFFQILYQSNVLQNLYFFNLFFTIYVASKIVRNKILNYYNFQVYNQSINDLLKYQ